MRAGGLYYWWTYSWLFHKSLWLHIIVVSSFGGGFSENSGNYQTNTLSRELKKPVDFDRHTCILFAYYWYYAFAYYRKLWRLLYWKLWRLLPWQLLGWKLWQLSHIFSHTVFFSHTCPFWVIHRVIHISTEKSWFLPIFHILPKVIHISTFYPFYILFFVVFVLAFACLFLYMPF